jgi:hypothetical protein
VLVSNSGAVEKNADVAVDRLFKKWAVRGVKEGINDFFL